MPGLRDSENSLDWIIQARMRLSRRSTAKPVTKAGQIQALWPQIEAARAAGQSMKSIHKWLQEDAGITISLSSLTSYTSCIRRRLAKRQPDAITGQAASTANATGTTLACCYSAVSTTPGNNRSPRPGEARSLSTEARHSQAPQPRWSRR